MMIQKSDSRLVTAFSMHSKRGRDDVLSLVLAVIASKMADESPGAYEKVVDRLGCRLSV